MQVFIIEPQLIRINTSRADKFNREVIKQLNKYGVSFCEVNKNNISRKILQLSELASREAMVILYNGHSILDDVKDKVEILLKKN